MEFTRTPGPKLSRAQWLVLTAAFLGWLFDGFELGLFPVIARPALLDLLGSGGDAAVGLWNARINACFLLGAAAGGICFGWLGDRAGRVRALTLSILTYSLFTGLSYFATAPWHLAVFRFIGALGMGGEWSLGVALVMECWPDKWRPVLATAIGAAGNLGFLLCGVVARVHLVTQDSWRWMFLVGAMPALLVVFIMRYVPESESWKKVAKTKTIQPMKEILAGHLKPTLLATCLATVVMIGIWGSIQWLPLWADQLTNAQNPAAKANVQMVVGLGAIVGCFIALGVSVFCGRRMTYFILCLSSLLLCGWMFRQITEFGTAFLITAFFVSVATSAFFGFFPLYFPELFPTRVRAMGQGLSYNLGRILAVGGVLAQGWLVAAFDGSFARAGAVVTLIYLVGMVVIWFAPETKGKPLPQ